MADEGQAAPAAPAPAEPTEQQAPAVFQVEVDKQMVNFDAADTRHVEAATKASLRQSDYTAKMQELARRRDALLDRELSAPTARPQKGLETGYGGFEGLLPSTPVGEEPKPAPTYPPVEYPNAGTPSGRGRSLAPYDVPGSDPDEPVTVGTLQRALQAQAQTMQQQTQQAVDSLRAQQAEAAAQQRIAEMSTDLPGFSETAVLEAFHLAPPADQQRYMRAKQTLGNDEAYRMVYNEQIVPQATPVPQTVEGAPTLEGQPQQTQQIATPPYAEGSRASGLDPNAAPNLAEGPADAATLTAIGESVMNLPTQEEVRRQT